MKRYIGFLLLLSTLSLSAQNYTKQFISNSSSELTLNCNSANAFEILLGSNVTISLSNITGAKGIRLWLVQDGTGNRVVHYSSQFTFTALFKDSTLLTANRTTVVEFTINDGKVYCTYNSNIVGSTGSSGGSTIFDWTRAITRTTWPTGITPGGTDLSTGLEAIFYPSTSPTATISSSQSISQEFMSAGVDLTTNLTWSATRPTACLAITSIIVNTHSQTLDSPFAEGHTQSGVLNTQALPRNTNTTYTNTVTSTDKSGTASTTITWYWKRYWGAFVSAVPPTDITFSISDAQILALTGAGIGTGSELSTTRVKTYSGIDGGGNYLVFAFPVSWGTPAFVINGLPSTAFTEVRSNAFVNTSGGTTTYQVWVSNTVQNSPITLFQIN